MKLYKLFTVSALLSLALCGCESNPSKPENAGIESATKTEKSASAESYGKAARKISQAIGEEVENFKIVSRSEGDSAPVGFSEGIYTVQTSSGIRYKCSIQEPSGIMNVLSYGGAGSVSAMCTNMTKGSSDRGKTNKASCNDLLRAAGKC